jgi:hypothetical protein
VGKLTLVPVLAAFLLTSAPVDATSVAAPSSAANASVSTAAQAKAAQKATKQAAKAAKKKAKLCAKKNKKSAKKQAKLLAKKRAAGCFASNANGIGTEVLASGAGDHGNSGNNGSQSTGVDPATFPYVFTQSPGGGGENQGSNGGTIDVTAAITAVPEPGTLGLLGLTLFGIGFARRRSR